MRLLLLLALAAAGAAQTPDYGRTARAAVLNQISNSYDCTQSFTPNVVAAATATITTAVTPPLGVAQACSWAFTSTGSGQNAYGRLTGNEVNGSVYTRSFYLKVKDAALPWFHFQVDTSSHYANFNISTCALGTHAENSGGAVPTVTNVGGGWCRVSITGSLQNTATNTPWFGPTTQDWQVSSDWTTTITAGQGMYVAGIQKEAGTTMSAYSETTGWTNLTANPSFTPATSSATCTTGQSAWDASFFYMCVGPNVWRRVAIATW